MILEEETFEAFGYYPGDWAPKSHKKILAACDECGKVRILSKAGYHALCKSCVHKGEKSHFFGKHPVSGIKDKHHSEKTKRKISEGRKGRSVSEEHKQKLSDANKGQIPWIKGKHHTEEAKEKLSEANRGENNYMFGKHHTEDAKNKICESRKHRKFPKQHTKPERIWQEIAIDKHSLSFKYTGDASFWIGKNPAINPDFVECNGKKIAIEIAGDWWHNPLFNLKLPYKYTMEYRKKMLKKYGWKLIVFFEHDLLSKDAETIVLSELKKHGISPEEHNPTQHTTATGLANCEGGEK